MGYKFFINKIELKQPVKTENQYLQGSNFRGVYISEYIRKNKIKIDISLDRQLREKLLSNKVRFSNAYPMFIENGECMYTIPAPLFLSAKKDAVKLFTEKNKPITDIDLRNDFEKGETKEGFNRLIKSQFVLLKEKTMSTTSVDFIESLHMSKQVSEGNIFRFVALEKKQKFYSIIQCDEESINDIKDVFQNKKIYVGGSKTSGYGLCETKLEGPFDYCNLKKELNISNTCYDKKNRLEILALSDIISKDEYGNNINKILEKHLEKYLGVSNVKLEKSICESRETNGYNSRWKGLIPKETAIKAGSIFEYSYSGQIKENALEKLEIRGIGSRIEVGYGNVAINSNLTQVKTYMKKEFKEIKNKVEIGKKINNLKENEKNILENIYNRINLNRRNEMLEEFLFVVIEQSKNERKNIAFKFNLNNAQISKIMNMLQEALEIYKKDKNKESSKRVIIKFVNELKTGTKDKFEKRNLNAIFNYSLKDYLNELSQENIDIDELIEEKINEQKKSFKLYKSPVKFLKVNNIYEYYEDKYVLAIIFTIKLMSYQLRKGGIK